MSKHAGVTVQCHVCGANKEIEPKIVRAVNMHDELLEALKEAVRLLETEVRPIWEQTHFRKVIAKAEGK